jgi:hypothetical protein
MLAFRNQLALARSKVRHDQLGVHVDEFLSEHTVQQVDIGGMNAEAIVDHRKMPQAEAVQAIHRQHHVRGIERMNQVRDDAIHLLPPVDLPFLILFMERPLRELMKDL